MSPAVAILRTLRPRQWVKNLFVVAPLVFSKHLFDAGFALRSAAAAAVFCALSGAVYAFNDVLDVDRDRLHPIKRLRPIAAGALAVGSARMLALVLAGAALAAGVALAPALGLVGAGYLAVNLAYSLRLKHVAFVDVGLIAVGFLLRVVGGALALDVAVSPWLLTCTALLASLLGFGKRAHELGQAQAAGRAVGDTRAALQGYSATTLRWALYALALATSAAYAWYTQDHRTVHYFGTRHLVWTLPFCVLGIARFLHLTLRRTDLDSPTEVILTDGLFLANMAAWGAAVLTIIYGAR